MLDSERTGRVSVEQLLNLDEFQKLVDVLYKPVSKSGTRESLLLKCVLTVRVCPSTTGVSRRWRPYLPAHVWLQKRNATTQSATLAQW